MQLLQFVIIKLSPCLILGILTGKLLHVPLWPSLFLCLFLLLLLGLEHRLGQRCAHLRFGLLAALSTMAIGILAIALTRPANSPDHYSHFLDHKDRLYTLKIREVLKPNNFSDRYTAQVIRMDSFPVSGMILLNIRKGSHTTSHEIDDEIITFGPLVPITSPLNPYQFDYRGYLSDMGIAHQANIALPHYLSTDSPNTTLFGTAAKIRGHIIKRLKREAFGEAELGIIQALLLGQRNEISEATNTDYKNAGAFHILALSGLHIGIILGLLHFLLRPLEMLPKGRSVKLVLIVLLLWGFAFLAGMSPSILRAVGMFTFVAYALYLNRPTNPFNTLALSLFFILLIFDPLLLFHVGFQLSYAAVFAIVWIYPLLMKLWLPANRLLKRGWGVIAVSLAAQLGVLPVTLFYFHQFPGLFLLSSLLILPPLAIILGLGILILFLALINMLPSFLVVLYNTIIHWMNSVIAWIAGQESFLFKSISFDAVQLVLTYGIIISWVSLLAKRSYKRAVWMVAFIIALQLWGLAIKYHNHGKESLFIGHIGRNSALVHQLGPKLTIYSNNPPGAERLATDYAIALKVEETINRPLANSYIAGMERIIMVDSTFGSLPDIPGPFSLWLTQSPKINLERLLDSVRPRMIIADGTNYRSYIDQWKQTCIKKKIPFHYTGEKGAYMFNLP